MVDEHETLEENCAWPSLGLSDRTLELLDEAGFYKPTPIQSQAIPLALAGRDLIASAQTGSGKTASFCLPLIEKLVDRKGTFGLILCPTREIALQTQETMEQFGKPQGVTSIALIGGVDVRSDERALGQKPHVIVGTPGRLCDHLDRGNLWLEYIEMLILDEADRMLDMGFAKELTRITQEIQESRQTLLFSATIPPSIDQLAKKILKKPERITIGRPLSAAKSVDQTILWTNDRDKAKDLMALLRRERETIIVFTRTKDGCYKLWRKSLDFGFEDSTYISSNKRQIDREKALVGFKNGKYRILFATDVAGRGIHVENVGHVVNFDLPLEPEDYIHRIGRTGRKGAEGRSTTFATPRDKSQIRRIERLLGEAIPSEEPKRAPARTTSRRSSSSRSAGRSSSGRGRTRTGQKRSETGSRRKSSSSRWERETEERSEETRPRRRSYREDRDRRDREDSFRAEERDRSRGNERGGGRSRNTSRGQSRSRVRDRDADRDRVRTREHDNDRTRERDRGRDRDRDRSRERSRGRSRAGERDRPRTSRSSRSGSQDRYRDDSRDERNTRSRYARDDRSESSSENRRRSRSGNRRVPERNERRGGNTRKKAAASKRPSRKPSRTRNRNQTGNRSRSSGGGGGRYRS